MISVNLLPPEMQAEIADSKKNRLVISALYQIIAVLIAALLLLGGFYYYFQTTLAAKKATYEQKTKTILRFGILEENARKIADKIDTIKKINDDGYRWSGIFDEINQIVPTGVSLNSIKIDTYNKARGQITGYAASKTHVAVLRDALEKSSKFQFVDIENSTTQEDPVTKREVESFTISFSLEKGALK